VNYEKRINRQFKDVFGDDESNTKLSVGQKAQLLEYHDMYENADDGINYNKLRDEQVTKLYNEFDNMYGKD